MKTGDKIVYCGSEWTIIEVEEDTVHVVDASGNGLAILKSIL